MPVDPSEVDRIAQLTGLPLMRLVDWKNRSGDPFELKCVAKENGAYRLELNTPQPTIVETAVPVVHGDYESRKEEDGALVYKALPGNSLGQVVGNDGRPTFGVSFDMTELDADGRPVFKIYFGSAMAWFVKNVYHQRWNELRDAKNELEPPQEKPAASSEPADERVGKERGRNPRDRARNEQRGGGRGGGHGGGYSGHGGGHGGSQGGGGQGGGQGGGGQGEGQGGGERQGGGRRRGRRGGRGRGRGGGGRGGDGGGSGEG